MSLATSFVLVVAFARSDTTPERSTSGDSQVPETATPGATSPRPQPGEHSRAHPVTRTGAS
jgi:hypothetical protein